MDAGQKVEPAPPAAGETEKTVKVTTAETVSVPPAASSTTETAVVPSKRSSKAGGEGDSDQEGEDNMASFAAVEFDHGFKSHTGETPLNSSAPDKSERRRNAATTTVYGLTTTVSAQGTFPEAGSILGPYFFLGRLGKGTFSSIHKCINMHYFHNGNTSDRRRLAAAKVELLDFSQSGILDSEATLLDFLHRSLPSGTVPVYMGHYKTAVGKSHAEAIVMEYLPGQDMHQLREDIMAVTKKRTQHQHQQDHQQYHTRRISTEDAIYLTADVFLPLLQRLHQVGVVHRDVKPSNCVRSSETERTFCIVDFGLSKSIVVPKTSEYADTEHAWDESKPWLKPLHYTGPGAYRMERSKADFRGTSMYASLRVHQGRDYSPRDDVWSLLYVFCDLVSGGLPWMSNAANRDRAGCQKLKERAHDDAGSGKDETAILLMGDHYHVVAYKRQRQIETGVTDEKKLATLPEPLKMSKDQHKVGLLRKAFQHVAQLQFYDTPDYCLIEECIRGFSKDSGEDLDPAITPIVWNKPVASPFLNNSRNCGYPVWELQDPDDADPLEYTAFQDVQVENQSRSTNMINRLPLEFQFHLAQMKQNAADVPPHRALNDWIRVVLRLLYEDWNAKRYEDGGHRTSTDGFRRERYLELLQECELCAAKHDYFRSRDCYFTEDVTSGSETASAPLTKRRKVAVHHATSNSKGTPLIYVSRALFGLETAIEDEKAKKPPPPVRISFS